MNSIRNGLGMRETEIAKRAPSLGKRGGREPYGLCQPIEDYGSVGDTYSVSPVGMDSPTRLGLSSTSRCWATLILGLYAEGLV
jgi:hypothetical protein